MPRNKDLKQLVRTRMQKTGESYTTARSHITKKAAAKPTIDYAKLAGKSDAVISERTGKTWQEWVRILDRAGAADMKHGDVARMLTRNHDITGWWAQTVTVGYERIKGKRAIGQRMDGSYEVSKSRTVGVPVEDLFDAWANARKRKRWLPEKVDVRTATPYKTIRLAWSDGSVVVVGFIQKSDAKSAVSMSHTKLKSRAVADEMKRFWTERLTSMAELVAAK